MKPGDRSYNQHILFFYLFIHTTYRRLLNGTIPGILVETCSLLEN